MVVSKNSILIIADQETIWESLGKRLTFLGYNVYLAANPNDTLTLFPQDKLDLVVFDAILPILDNYQFCQALRQTLKIPLIILTEPTKFMNSAGRELIEADDYILKPFVSHKLEIQIFDRISCFRNQPIVQNTLNSSTFYIKNLTIELENHKLLKSGHEIKLTNREFNLLKFLLSNAGITVSRSTILREVWGYIPKRAIDLRVVDVYISRLRLKLEDEPTNPVIILTFRGTGYRLQL